MILRFNVDQDMIRFFNSTIYFKRNRSDLNRVSQEYKLTALDLLSLNNLENYKSADQIYMELYRKFGKADYRIIHKRLRYMKMKKIVSSIIF